MNQFPATSRNGSCLVIGLGNPILGDDGVGWRVAEYVSGQLSELQVDNSIEIDYLSLGGLSLMERMVGYSSVILIDAMTSHQVPVGTVSSFKLDELPNRALGHLCSSHDTTLQNALEIGRKMGAELPGNIQVVSIEAQQVFDFSETLSAQVQAAVPKAAELVFELLKIGTTRHTPVHIHSVELP